jgi:hypothetical protein
MQKLKKEGKKLNLKIKAKPNFTRYLRFCLTSQSEVEALGAYGLQTLKNGHEVAFMDRSR